MSLEGQGSKCGPMVSSSQNGIQSSQRSQPESRVVHRRRPLRVLFIHRDADAVDHCLQELKKAQFMVSADIVLTLTQGTEQLRSASYDVLVAEYPSPGWKGSQSLHLLRQTAQDVPLLFLTTSVGSMSITELTTHGAFDYVEEERIAQLPMAVRRALNEKELRLELQEARMALRHSQSLYRALVDNPAYGICRCSGDGQLVDVNQALVAMLGYANREDLLAANYMPEVISALGKGSTRPRHVQGAGQIEPVEIEWKRKNGTILKARVSGRGVYDERADLVGHEFIVVDITEQRLLEEQLRHQASSDSLTGLANHRRLFEVLHAEICRSKRTQRGFSLVLLDLDGLKVINDRFGHLTGDRALCRLAQILADCSRSIDTAARHGGDEFALVLPETGVGAASMVARRICELLAKDAEKPALSVSIGVASFPKEAETIGTLLYAADKALYEMKSKQPKAMRASRAS
jgi:diguanylate cyclase (GGDEF)-like protein/PAS domain S-box-containing protein